MSVMDSMSARGVADLPESLYPWGYDAAKFDSIVRKYVQGYVDVYWPIDADVFADPDITRCDATVCTLQLQLLCRSMFLSVSLFEQVLAGFECGSHEVPRLRAGRSKDSGVFRV